MFGLDTTLTILLVLCILAAMAFEFINGFHDTANAVATVIYTNSLKPMIAVIWSGLWNFLGVYTGGIAVAIGIINLLPLEILIDQNVYHSISMILALILTAIIWNLGTWYFGIPCSSSHTLIGSIFGVVIAYSLLPDSSDIMINWGKIKDVALSLLVSPIIGFGLAFGLLYLLKKFVSSNKLFDSPETGKKPPLLIRSILILTCTSVSFSHGSNDGQKGVGLVMIILIGIIPFYFAINKKDNPQKLNKAASKIEILMKNADTAKLSDESVFWYNQTIKNIKIVKSKTEDIKHFDSLAGEDLYIIRKSILTAAKNFDKLSKLHGLFPKNTETEISGNFKSVRHYTEYAPTWVILLISLSLGAGTMVGWKRIVVTIGEKIGHTHLSYVQGATAEIIAASTIGLSTMLGLPVSTTHVLSSGVAGTMVAKKKKNLKKKTIKNIGIAWIVTLPVTIILSASLFLLFRWISG